MKNILIDTNALISFVTTRDIRQSEIMDSSFSKPSHELKIHIISNVLTEFIFVLDKVYGVSRKLIQSMAIDLIKMPNTIFLQDYQPENIFKLWPTKIKDYGDAVLAATASVNKIPVYTFDKKFCNQLKELKIDFTLLK